MKLYQHPDDQYAEVTLTDMLHEIPTESMRKTQVEALLQDIAHRTQYECDYCGAELANRGSLCPICRRYEYDEGDGW